MTQRHFRRITLAALLLAAGAAQAHDSWFEAAAGGLRLGTGALFPKHETAIGEEYLRQRGCRGGGRELPLRVLGLADVALLAAAPPQAGSCWAQTAPFEVELPADKIAPYFAEVRPTPALLAAWADIQARGLPWKERYTKHARIALPGAGDAAATPSDMGMDVLLEGPPQRGRELTFQLLRDGRPLPDFAVELRSDRSRFGIWRRTDADGRLRFTPPFAGQWLLRAIDLRLSETQPDSFDSRFVTLAFEAVN
jgi:hypothetical protein